MQSNSLSPVRQFERHSSRQGQVASGRQLDVRGKTHYSGVTVTTQFECKHWSQASLDARHPPGSTCTAIHTTLQSSCKAGLELF